MEHGSSKKQYSDMRRYDHFLKLTDKYVTWPQHKFEVLSKGAPLSSNWPPDVMLQEEYIIYKWSNE